MSKILENQLKFAPAVAKLLAYASDTGIPVTIGEVTRSKAQAIVNAATGAGITNSLHVDGLAIDLKAYRMTAGTWLYLVNGDAPEYKLLGDYWKALDLAHAWGGDWTTGRPARDAGHFSRTIGDGRQ